MLQNVWKEIAGLTVRWTQHNHSFFFQIFDTKLSFLFKQITSKYVMMC